MSQCTWCLCILNPNNTCYTTTPGASHPVYLNTLGFIGKPLCNSCIIEVTKYKCASKIIELQDSVRNLSTSYSAVQDSIQSLVNSNSTHNVNRHTDKNKLIELSKCIDAMKIEISTERESNKNNFSNLSKCIDTAKIELSTERELSMANFTELSNMCKSIKYDLTKQSDVSPPKKISRDYLNFIIGYVKSCFVDRCIIGEKTIMIFFTPNGNNSFKLDIDSLFESIKSDSREISGIELHPNNVKISFK